MGSFSTTFTVHDPFLGISKVFAYVSPKTSQCLPKQSFTFFSSHSFTFKACLNGAYRAGNRKKTIQRHLFMRYGHFNSCLIHVDHFIDLAINSHRNRDL